MKSQLERSFSGSLPSAMEHRSNLNGSFFLCPEEISEAARGYFKTARRSFLAQSNRVNRPKERSIQNGTQSQTLSAYLLSKNAVERATREERKSHKRVCCSL